MQRLIIANKEVELEKSTSIPLVFRISEIRDISVRSGSHSKTIKIPGTKSNNELFGGIYDFNSDYTFFNPNIKTPCIFSNNGDEFIKGFVQLKTVIRDDKKNITYDCVLYDQILNFWNELDKQTISDLDFSDMNHIYTRDNIISSWSGDYQNPGYYYAMHFGTLNTIKTTDFRPAPYLKSVVEKIVSEAGFTWSGNLKNNPIFEKEIIQNEIDQPTISFDAAFSKTFKVSNENDVLFHTDNNINSPIVGSAIFYPMPDESTGTNQDPNNLFNGFFFTAPVNGNYRLRRNTMRVRAEIDYTVLVNTIFTQPAYAHVGASFATVIRDDLNVIRETIVEPVFFAQQVINRFSTSASFNSLFQNQILFVNGQQDVYLGQGWTVQMFVTPTGKTSATNFFDTAIDPKYQIDEVRLYLVAGGGLESQLVQYAYDDNTPLMFSDFLSKKLLQKDIIKDLIARYNCFIYPNPENPKDIVFNIRDEFYSSGGVVDWTNKKDYGTRDQVKLIGEIQSERIKLTYSEASDETNEAYTEIIGDESIYGQFEYDFVNDFTKGTKEIKSPHVPTPLVWSPGISAIVPSIPQKSAIKGNRILLVGGLKEVGSVSWVWNYRDAQGSILNSNQSGYPYAGHFDDPLNPTIDINFGELPFPDFYYSLNQTTNNNLFNRYWANAVSQIANGKLIISKFNLSSSDAFFVKNNPNTKVFVKNTYYYINKINFEANDSLRKLAVVELLTIEDDLIVNISNTTRNYTNGDIKNHFQLSENDFAAAGNLIPFGGNIVRAFGSNNTVAEGAGKTIINGNENFVSALSSDVFIQGNKNQIYGSNVTVIGMDGLIIRQDNITIINGVITKGEASSIFFNKIDGGKNELTPSVRRNKVNKINSQFNGVFNLFNVSLFNKINSNNGITEEI